MLLDQTAVLRVDERMPIDLFHKPLGALLTAEDLDLLVSEKVAEGYFVEFKSRWMPPGDIAKAIASFANTAGGWFFMGVAAHNAEEVAETIPGCPPSASGDPVASVREIVTTHLDPVPVIHPQKVTLPNGHFVLVS